MLGRQQYIVRPMVMDESCTPGTGSDNPAVAGSSGVISESALDHAPALTEKTVREHGIPLDQAIQQVLAIYQEVLKKKRENTPFSSVCIYSIRNDKGKQ